MCTRGSVVQKRPLPSLVTSTSVPVSAAAKFTPVMPMSARRNSPRSRSRAHAVSASRSTGEIGAAPPRASTSRICGSVLWIAGVIMCDGRSPASCTMYSPRSVSTLVMPGVLRARRRGRSPRSPSTCSSRPCARRGPGRGRRRRARASAGVAARCTCTPRAVSERSRRSSQPSRSSERLAPDRGGAVLPLGMRGRGRRPRCAADGRGCAAPAAAPGRRPRSRCARGSRRPGS